jgi:hypothetical protein
VGNRGTMLKVVEVSNVRAFYHGTDLKEIETPDHHFLLNEVAF